MLPYVLACVGGGVYVADMTTPHRLRLTAEHAAARMLAALADVNDVQAADLRAELTDPSRVSMGTVAKVGGLSRVPAHTFFEARSS